MHTKTLILSLCLACAAGANTRAQIDATLAAESVRGDATAWGLKQIGEDQVAAATYISLAIEQQIAQNAVSLGLTERMDVNRALHQARRRVLVQAMREEVARRSTVPTDEEVSEVYKARPSAFMEPEAYQLVVYQWPLEATAEVSKAEKVVASTHKASDIEALKGQVVLPEGSQNFITDKMIVPAIWEGLAGLKDGGSRWFTTENGHYWVKRISHRATRLPELDEIKENIRTMIRQRRAEAAWQEYVEKIQKGL